MSAAVAVAVGAFSLFAQGAPAMPQSQPAVADPAQITPCVERVAGELASKPFDQILDQAVLKCGRYIPFPVPPVERQAAMTERERQEREERQDGARRAIISRELKARIELGRVSIHDH